MEQKLVHLERSKEERKEQDKPIASDGPLYPWGLRLRLEEEELKKLGVEGLPEVGDEFHVHAVGEVVSVSQNASDDGAGGKHENKCVEIQITHMAAEHEEERSPSEIMYGHEDDED